MKVQYSRYLRAIYCCVLLAMTSACATTGGISEGDPFEGFNRGAFSFNKAMDKHLFNPIAEFYDDLVPGPVNEGITNIFSNLNDVSVIANEILQFKFGHALHDIIRLVVNSTIGLLGFFDVSTELGLPKHREDFGQTLGRWGIDSGPFLVIPLLGPATLRAATGLGVDGILLSPTSYIDNTAYRSGLMALQYIDFKADLLGTGELLGVAAVDEYSFLKSVYLQYRDKLVHDRHDDELEEAPDFDSYDE